jgi:hypothetical protein
MHTHDGSVTDATPAIDTTTGARGAACSPEHACRDGLDCLGLFGGYCASSCGPGGNACGDGVCVETRDGDTCFASCTRDDDCRADDGYVCDPSMHACLLPNLAAIVPQRCPLVGPERDVTFSPSEAWNQDASAPFGRGQIDPSAVIADDGSVIATFETLAADRDARGGAIVAYAGSPIVVSRQDDTASTFPRVARDRAGTVYATWHVHPADGSGAIVLATSHDRAATWSEPAIASDADDCIDHDCFEHPLIAIGPAPHNTRREVVYLAYATDTAGFRVRASSDGGATWSRATTALAGARGSAVVGEDGRLHLVAENGSKLGAYGSAHQTIGYAVSADGGTTFSSAITISGRDELIPFFFANPSIALDERRGWTYFAYARGGRDAKWDIALVATRDGGKTFVRKSLGDGCAIHMVPNLAVDPTTGTLHVAYYDTSGAPGRFAHATCSSGLTSCAPRGAIDSVPFAGLSTVRHAANALGDYASLVLDNKRRVLHAIWAEPIVDADGTLAAHLFHASAKLTLH